MAITPLKVIPLLDQDVAWKRLERMLSQLRDLYTATHHGGHRTLTWMVSLAREPISLAFVTNGVTLCLRISFYRWHGHPVVTLSFGPSLGQVFLRFFIRFDIAHIDSTNS